ASLTFAALSLLTASTGTSLHNLQTELRHLQPCAIAPDPSSWLAVEQALGRARICPPHAPCPTPPILPAHPRPPEPPPPPPPPPPPHCSPKPTPARSRHPPASTPSP